MNDKCCPVCGGQIQKHIIKKIIGNKEVNLINYVCLECKEEGDFFNEDNNKIELALKNNQELEIIKIIKTFEKERKNIAGIERALHIPQETFSKWRDGISKPELTSFALLKLIQVFPFLLNIADVHYDLEKSNQVIIDYVCKLLKHSEIDKLDIVYSSEEEKGLATLFFHSNKQKTNISENNYARQLDN